MNQYYWPSATAIFTEYARCTGLDRPRFVWATPTSSRRLWGQTTWCLFQDQHGWWVSRLDWRKDPGAPQESILFQISWQSFLQKWAILSHVFFVGIGRYHFFSDTRIVASLNSSTRVAHGKQLAVRPLPRFYEGDTERLLAVQKSTVFVWVYISQLFSHFLTIDSISPIKPYKTS